MRETNHKKKHASMKRFQSAPIFSRVGNFRGNKSHPMLTLHEKVEDSMGPKENCLLLKAF